MTIHAACGLATLLGLASPAFAEDCRLALVLALDVSGSLDWHEYRLEREGLARALISPEVVRAFLTGDPVALYVFEWSAPQSQVLRLGWRTVRTHDELASIAGAIAADDNGIRPPPSTALGGALGHAADALEDAPVCRARTVDIAGDGRNNHGPLPSAIYGSGRLDGVTVNALVVSGALDPRGEPEAGGNLVAYFEAEVLHGPGAFAILADGYEDFERAMRAKLLRELQGPMVSGLSLAEFGA